MKFRPSISHGSSRTGIIQNITVDEIIDIFGFGPNVNDDPYKVVHSWAVDVSKVEGGLPGEVWTVHVWDYKGSHEFGQFSVCGDPVVLEMIFGSRYVNETGAFRVRLDSYSIS